MKNFTLMILCAGFGSRMLNLTRSTPKPLLKYKNKVTIIIVSHSQKILDICDNILEIKDGKIT